MEKMIFIVICLALSGCAGKRLPLVKVSGYTSSNASATSNLFLLNKVTSEFSVGNIVTIGDSKKEHEIIKVTALNKSESGNSQSIILMDGVGFVVKQGWKVSVVGGGSLLDPPPPPPSDTSSPVVKVTGWTSHSAPATSNVFVLKGVTSEFWAGDIVTFGDSKKEHEIWDAKVLKKIAMPDNTWVVLYHGSKFKISPGSGNIHGIVIKGAVGFVISPVIKVSVVRCSTLDSYPERCNLGR